MRIFFTALVLACIVLSRGEARAATPIQTNCQKNLSDGRILVVDGRVLPENSRFKILSYRAVRQDSGWSYGPCTLKVN
jgi:hypothetical protein